MDSPVSTQPKLLSQMNERAVLSELAGCPVELALTTRHDVDFILGRLDTPSSARPADSSNRLGARLLALGVISDLQLRAALRIQKRTGERLGNIIVEEGFGARDEVEDIFAGGGGRA